MNRHEAKLRKRLASDIGTRWHMQSHEDKYDIGIPDLSYGFGKVNGWIELKFIKSFNGPNLVKPKEFTSSQCNWIAKRNRHGGHCYIIVQVGDEIFLLRGAIARLVRHGMNEDHYRSHAIGCWAKHVNPDEFLKIISE